MKKKFYIYCGFHLIEILITLAIISILTMISIPIYSQHLVRERRMEAAGILSTLAIAMEKYQIEHNSYRDASLTALRFSQIIVKNHYRLIIQSATENNYVLTAEPLGEQAGKDTDCGTLTLDAQGEKSVSGSAEIAACW